MEESFLASIPLLKALTGAERTLLAVSSRQALSESLERGLRMAGVEVVPCPDRYPVDSNPS